MKKRCFAICIILVFIISVISSGCNKPVEKTELNKEREIAEETKTTANPTPQNDEVAAQSVKNDVITDVIDDKDITKEVEDPNKDANIIDPTVTIENEFGDATDSVPYIKQLIPGDTDPIDGGTPKEYIDDVKRMYIDTIHNMIMPKLCRIVADYRAEYADTYEYCYTIAEYETNRSVWVYQNKSSLDNPEGTVSEMLYLWNTPYCMVAKHLGLEGWVYQWIRPKKWPYTLTTEDFVPDHILKLSDIITIQPLEGKYAYRDYVDEETGEFITGLDVRQAKFEGDDNIYHYYCMWADKNPSYPREVYKSVEGVDSQGRPYRIDIRMLIESDTSINGKYRADDITSNKADLAKYIDTYMNDNYNNVESFVQDGVVWYKWENASDGTIVRSSYDEILEMLDLIDYKPEK